MSKQNPKAPLAKLAKNAKKNSNRKIKTKRGWLPPKSIGISFPDKPDLSLVQGDSKKTSTCEPLSRVIMSGGKLLTISR
jgi:hypothetical protein